MPAARITPQIRQLWIRFKATGERTLRNVLMENYLHLVKYNADRISARLPGEVESDDLVSAGVFGLVDAIDSFDLERGVKFETYCAPRIRGAILDELRSLDWVPRLVRSRAAKLEEANRTLEVELGRTPYEDELAKRLNLAPGELDKLLRDAPTVSLVSLSRKHYETESSRDVREIDVLEDKRGADPLVETQNRDLKALVTRGLSRAERLVLILYYYEAMTMKEIGTVLDLSESRVSQMHSNILGRLKTQFSQRNGGVRCPAARATILGQTWRAPRNGRTLAPRSAVSA
ncbi:MAG: FliA/WhiG family RNA polymerase sigma factor [bacterium]|nr:FliA/WhiG family RNA polymerase sigma factor [bacterium]